MSDRVRALTWNLEWATARAERGRVLRDRILAAKADVVCLTEAHEGLLSDGGFIVTAGADWGYRAAAGRRKVLLWSRRPWTSVDAIGSPDLPPGRFISATTATALGPVRCIGVCIPWYDAHVRTGQSNRKRWEDHVAYLRALEHVFDAAPAGPTILLGDFNQTLPRSRAPRDVHEAMTRMLAKRFVVASAGLHDAKGGLAIDHIACSPALTVVKVAAISAQQGDRELSDHFGVLAELANTCS